jgi:hypothetical protein
VLLKGDIRGVEHFSLVPIPQHITRAIWVEAKVCTGLGPRAKLATSLPLVIVIEEDMSHTAPDFELFHVWFVASPDFRRGEPLQHVVRSHVGQSVGMNCCIFPKVHGSPTVQKQRSGNGGHRLVPGLSCPILLGCIGIGQIGADMMSVEVFKESAVEEFGSSVTLEGDQAEVMLFLSSLNPANDGLLGLILGLERYGKATSGVVINQSQPIFETPVADWFQWSNQVSMKEGQTVWSSGGVARMRDLVSL